MADFHLDLQLYMRYSVECLLECRNKSCKYAPLFFHVLCPLHAQLKITHVAEQKVDLPLLRVN